MILSYILIEVILFIVFAYLTIKDQNNGIDLSLADIINATIMIIIFPLSICAYLIFFGTQWVYDTYGDVIIIRGIGNEN